MDNTPPDELDTRLDTRLLQLAQLAQQHLPRTKERRIALTKLVEEINRQSYRLVHPSSSQYPSYLCPDIFSLALQKLLFFIFHPDTNIDSYKSDRGTVRVWINIKLHKRFFGEAKDELIETRVVNGELLQITNLSDWNSAIEQQMLKNNPYSDKNSISEDLLKFIQDDPEGLFQTEHINNYPHANFRSVALSLIAGKSWREISAELGIEAISTTSSFYYRCVKKFAPKLKAYLQE